MKPLGNDDARAQFVAAVSHGVRTPLNAIIGMADVLAETTLTREQRECVEAIQRSGISLLNLFNQGLGIALETPEPAAIHVRTNEQLELRISNLRVLLAEDSDDNRQLILSYLRRSGVHIVTAENGEIALSMFVAGNFDVVLMDVEMPVMDGPEATARIRKWEREQGREPTPILALTAHSLSEMQERGIGPEFTSLLTKPLRKSTLLEALADLVPGINAIEVEPDLSDLVPAYLEKRRADIGACERAMESEDFDSIGKLAHKMKGTGAGYGFPGLTAFGEAIGKAAMGRNAPLLRQLLDALAQYLQRLPVTPS